MALRWLVRPNAYHDSIKLMRVSEMLAQAPGVLRAAAVMGTPLNLELLAGDGLLPPEESGLEGPGERRHPEGMVRPTAEDLVIAILAQDERAAVEAMSRVDDLLTARSVPSGGEAYPEGPRPAHTLEQAVRVADKGAVPNLAVIGVPGPYAAAEAFAALRSGLHVFLFSDNVPIEQEVQLKRLAADLDLLMMGPDCGTAIIGGVGLGFANRVAGGPVGIVGASGTGIQQVCCLLDQCGIGIAQAVGTGGRDLSAPVGGSMTRRALRMLEADDEVEIIALISKPADSHTAYRLHRDLLPLSKPCVACLLGETPPDEGRVRYARTLTDAAALIAEMVPSTLRPPLWTGVVPGAAPTASAGEEGERGRVYGLFAGGTLCSEAAQILDSMGVAHHLIDLGADEYTHGRAHPIIDPRLRTSMLADLAGRADVGAVLLDVILGDLAHPDPAGVLLPALAAIKPVPVFAALVGSRADPQGLERQRSALEEAGAHVFASNAHAAAAAGRTAAKE